jgi:uncharacterized membrane protein (UPF0127 family)
LFYISISFANDKEECKPISIGKVDLCVELALTKTEKAKGLMYRKKLTDIDGMLFCSIRSWILSRRYEFD